MRKNRRLQIIVIPWVFWGYLVICENYLAFWAESFVKSTAEKSLPASRSLLSDPRVFIYSRWWEFDVSSCFIRSWLLQRFCWSILELIDCEDAFLEIHGFKNPMNVWAFHHGFYVADLHNFSMCDLYLSRCSWYSCLSYYTYTWNLIANHL